MTDNNYVPEIQEVIASGHILNVLVVDDSKPIRSAIREILELGNIQVTEASSGKEALELVYNTLPDLLLLDAVMPDLDGVSVLKTLRQSYSKMHLPIVLITAKETSTEIVQVLDFGANDYITKPIDYDVLWARLSNQLMQKRASEYLRMAKLSLEKQIKERTAELNSANKKLKEEIEIRVVAEEQLQKQANFDSLTSLPNRSLAADRLKQTLSKAKRHNLEPCLVVLDLDNFKYVNDTFGHGVGDELLRKAAKRLSDCARESDTVARLGGDEFLIILEDDNTNSVHNRETEIRRIGERIIKSFSKPIIIDKQELNISTSIGFAIYPKDGEDETTLMRHADVAMYRSKHDGKNTYCFYSPDMTVKAKMRMKIESHLRYALEKNELTVNYQPIIDSKSGTIVRAEALLRWNCKSLGMITPDFFIPIAEETGLILPIGEWVVKTACKQVKQWRDLGWKDICISINVSARQIHTKSFFVETLKESLQDNHLTPDAIQIELTEGVLMKETKASLETMTKIEEIGIKFLIDDFGTGYASLSYLQRYSFVAIKIDRSYIQNILVSKQDENLVKAVMAMAHSLGISVVSEGVESKGQLDLLIEEGCEFIQGFYYSKPVIAEEFLNLLQDMNNPMNKLEAM